MEEPLDWGLGTVISGSHGASTQKPWEGSSYPQCVHKETPPCKLLPVGSYEVSVGHVTDGLTNVSALHRWSGEQALRQQDPLD